MWYFIAAVAFVIILKSRRMVQKARFLYEYHLVHHIHAWRLRRERRQWHAEMTRRLAPNESVPLPAAGGANRVGRGELGIRQRPEHDRQPEVGLVVPITGGVAMELARVEARPAKVDVAEEWERERARALRLHRLH